MKTHNLSPISVIFVSVYSMFCFAPSFSGQIASANLQMEKLSHVSNPMYQIHAFYFLIL